MPRTSLRGLYRQAMGRLRCLTFCVNIEEVANDFFFYWKPFVAVMGLIAVTITDVSLRRHVLQNVWKIS